MDFAYYILTPFTWLLQLFNSLTGGYGFALILFAVVVKLILFPFSLKSKRGQNRLGFTVGKKVGCAVKRNRVRRRLREIYRLHEDELVPGYDIVVVARVKAVYARYAQLEKSFLSLADKLGLRKKAEG